MRRCTLVNESISHARGLLAKILLRRCLLNDGQHHLAARTAPRAPPPPDERRARRPRALRLPRCSGHVRAQHPDDAVHAAAGPRHGLSPQRVRQPVSTSHCVLVSSPCMLALVPSVAAANPDAAGSTPAASCNTQLFQKVGPRGPAHARAAPGRANGRRADVLLPSDGQPGGRRVDPRDPAAGPAGLRAYQAARARRQGLRRPDCQWLAATRGEEAPH